MATFQPADYVMFGSAEQGDYVTKPDDKGDLGSGGARHDHRRALRMILPRRSALELILRPFGLDWKKALEN